MTLWCIRCGREAEDSAIRCECGGLLEVRPGRIAYPALSVLDARRSSRRPIDQSGVWRFRECVMDIDESRIITHPEGATRLYERDGVFFKHEGENPTGSFKDRGMTVAITHAVRLGARAVACASTGNTSASLAAYAAQAGLRAIVFVPAGKIAAGKLAQTLAYGALVLQVRGDFDDAMRLVLESSQRLGIYVVNSINPFRIEGQKTIVWELLQDLDWNPPDWIVVPAGNLGNTSAFGKALVEARQAGWIDRLPRIAAIQAHGANPFYRAYRENFPPLRAIDAETVATAIRIGNPVSYEKAAAAIRATNGVVEEVTDEELMAAKRDIDRMGIGCEPASATTLAGVRKLGLRGRVVCVLTGHVLKDPDAIIKNASPEQIVEIDANIGEVERVLL